jgi:hypothetical protein
MDEEGRGAKKLPYHGSKFCISYTPTKTTKQMKVQEELE